MSGEYAFPVPSPANNRGMMLRDYFAARAMESILERIPQMPNERIADQAYTIADAMLRRREQTG